VEHNYCCDEAGNQLDSRVGAGHLRMLSRSTKFGCWYLPLGIVTSRREEGR